MNVLKALPGYDSESNAYLVQDYPYGFRLRTQIRYWVETKTGFGQRFCSQTLNPKTSRWNTPKKGTYNILIAMGLDEKNYVTTTGLSRSGYSTEEQIQKFEEMFSPLTQYQKVSIKLIRLVHERYQKAKELV